MWLALDTDAGRAAFWAESAPESDGIVHFRFINGYLCQSRVLERRAPALWVIDYIGGPARFGSGRTGAAARTCR